MADENRMITFEYARTTWDQFKKQVIPNTKECMTKTDIIAYLDANVQKLAGYAADQLIPRIRFEGNIQCARFNGAISHIRLDNNNKLILSGDFTTINSTPINRVSRIQNNGLIDNTFNIGSGFSINVNRAIPQPDGKIIVGGGFNLVNGIPKIRIARLNSNGSVDTTFNTGEGFEDWVYNIEYLSDTRIVVSGIFSTFNGTSANRVIILNSDGSKDQNFNIGVGFNSTVHAMAVDESYSLVFLGGFFTSFNNITSNRIIALDMYNGQKDVGFNIGSGFNANVSSINVIESTLFVCGNFTTYKNITCNNIIKLYMDGTKDTSFSGYVFTNGIYQPGIRKTLLLQNNKLLVIGSFLSYNGFTANNIIRLNPNGSVDTTFNSGSGFNGEASDAVVQANGEILIVGKFTMYNGSPAPYFARLNYDGSSNTNCIIN